jgi:hypothetical protein
MSIERINDNLPTSSKISTLSEQLLEIFGLVKQAAFDKNEVEQLTTDFGLSRKYLRDQSLGHTLATYVGWTHIQAESGYSIWKYSPTNYKYNSLNELYLDDVVFENRGLADSEIATTFDNVYLDEGSVFTNNTTEAGTEDGTSFSLMNDTSDYLYVGLSTTFAGISFEFDSRGSNYTLECEYWNGSSWTSLDVSGATYEDDTSNFESDGRIYWTIPSNWATTSVNGLTKYWVRIFTSTVPTTVAEAFLIIPANSVVSLLKLSSTEIFNEDWAWCSYGTAIYVTIRNIGQSSYEGNYYITSASSSINKQNYFIHNHEFTSDYEDSTYVQTGIEPLIDTTLIPFDYSVMTATNFYDAIIEIYDITATGTTVNGAPLTKTGVDIKFNYDTDDFQLSGNNLQIKDIFEPTITLLSIAKGGTNSSSLTQNKFLYFNGTSIIASDYYNTDFATSSHTHTLDDLSNVSVNSGLIEGQIMVYDSATSLWRNTSDLLVLSTGNIKIGVSSYINYGSTEGSDGYGFRDNAGTIQWKNSTGAWADIGSGGGGATTLDELTDVFASSGLGDKDILAYDNGMSLWRNQTASELGLGKTRGTFVNGDLSTGVLTITHNLGLSAPYELKVTIFDNNGAEILGVDSIVGSTNSIVLTMTSFGTLSGTWGYEY